MLKQKDGSLKTNTSFSKATHNQKEATYMTKMTGFGLDK